VKFKNFINFLSPEIFRKKNIFYTFFFLKKVSKKIFFYFVFISENY